VREEGKLEGAKIIAMGWWSVVSDGVLEKLFGDRFPGWHAEHASVCETSLMLHLRNDLVGPTEWTTPHLRGQESIHSRLILQDIESRRSGKQLAFHR